MSEHIIELIDIEKYYGDKKVLDDINLYIRKNEFLTLLGPSGCGKTTTLRIIGGFEGPTSGSVLLDGKKINDMPPYLRPLNTVFQNYALFPHMNVFDNIGFGLKIKKVKAKDLQEQVKKMLKLVNLEGYGQRNINSLSGGEKQRVAIARALVNKPQLLLLDEPLGALDLKMRQEMQLELKNMQKSLGITFIYVTHDQEEALTMSDTIVILDKGKIQQIGTPEDIYNKPQNSFVADFIGESNIITAQARRCKSGPIVNFSEQDFYCADSILIDKDKDNNNKNNNKDLPEDQVKVVVRPEDIQMVEANAGMLNGQVESVVFLGVNYELMVKTKNCTLNVKSKEPVAVNSTVGLVIEADSIHIMEE